MGSYKNPKTRAKAYKKSTSEKLKYANEHRDKEIAKQKEKKQNINKYNRKKVEKKDKPKTEDIKKTNKPKQIIKVVKHKKPDNKPKFKPCAKTIIQFNKQKRKDHGLYLMIPIHFGFFSGKLDENSVERIGKLFNTNLFMCQYAVTDEKISFKYGTDYKQVTKAWTRRKLKTSLGKLYYGMVDNNVFCIKYNHSWWFVIDIGNIMESLIDDKLKNGAVTYKYHIDNLYNVNGHIAVLTDDCKLNCVSCRDIIDFRSEEDKVWFYWNDKESYGEICKEYHRFLRKANNVKKNIDLRSFYMEAHLLMEFTEVVVKTSPMKDIKSNNAKSGLSTPGHDWRLDCITEDD